MGLIGPIFRHLHTNLLFALTGETQNILVEDGRVVARGADVSAPADVPRTDHAGRRIMPGVRGRALPRPARPASTSSSSTWVPRRPGTRRSTWFGRGIASSPKGWLHAVHYDQNRYGAHLTRHDLDAISDAQARSSCATSTGTRASRTPPRSGRRAWTAPRPTPPAASTCATPRGRTACCSKTPTNARHERRPRPDAGGDGRGDPARRGLDARAGHRLRVRHDDRALRPADGTGGVPPRRRARVRGRSAAVPPVASVPRSQGDLAGGAWGLT